MQWRDGHVYVAHPREPWDAHSRAGVSIHASLDDLRGRTAAEKAAYISAKQEFNVSAAFDIIERIRNDEALDKIVDAVIAADTAPIFVYPYPAFDDDDGPPDTTATLPTNALPLAYAHFLVAQIGGSVDEEIQQAARVGRSKLSPWLRFLCQPAFAGTVRPGASYFIIDDVLTTGGTAAALRAFIIRSGGMVIGFSALAHGAGNDQQLAVAHETLNVVKSLYGEGISGYWAEAFGHGIECITDIEGRRLISFAKGVARQGVDAGDAILQHLRTRLAKAAAQGR